MVYQVGRVNKIPNPVLLAGCLVTFDEVGTVSPSVIILVALDVNGLCGYSLVSCVMQTLLRILTIIVLHDRTSVLFLSFVYRSLGVILFKLCFMCFNSLEVLFESEISALYLGVITVSQVHWAECSWRYQR